MVVVLDAGREDVETVDLGRHLGGQRADRPVAGFGNVAGGAGVVGAHAALDPVRLEELCALRQEDEVRVGRADVRELRPAHAEQVDVHPHEGLAHDVEPAFGQQPVDVGDPPVGRVLDRQHRQIRRTRAHCLDHVLERAAGHHLHLGVRLVAGLVGIGPRLSLEGDASGHAQQSFFLGLPAGFAGADGRFVAPDIP